MKVLVQRVRGAQVEVGSQVVARIERGLLLYVGIGDSDQSADTDWLAGKIATLRIFEDDQGKLNLGAAEVGGAILAVPNFTLMGDARKGRRPSFDSAAPPGEALPLFERFVQRLGEAGLHVETGQFGAHMHILAIADGPVNLVLDTAAVWEDRPVRP